MIPFRHFLALWPMMTRVRKPFTPELIARVRETGSAAILAGCDPAETVDLCRRSIEDWRQENPASPGHATSDAPNRACRGR